jgi:hypothetical protein
MPQASEPIISYSPLAWTSLTSLLILVTSFLSKLSVYYKMIPPPNLALKLNSNLVLSTST